MKLHVQQFLHHGVGRLRLFVVIVYFVSQIAERLVQLVALVAEMVEESDQLSHYELYFLEGFLKLANTFASESLPLLVLLSVVLHHSGVTGFLQVVLQIRYIVVFKLNDSQVVLPLIHSTVLQSIK